MTGSRQKLNFDAGKQIIKEGDIGGNLMIIESGMVEVFQERHGEDIVLAQLGPGEILGVMTLLDSQRRAASVRAKTNVVINEVPADRVQKLIKDIPSWATSIIRDLVTRVRQADSLYTSTKAHAGKAAIQGPYLSVGTRVAEGFAPLAELMLEEGQNEIPIQKILTKLTQILGEDLEIVTRVFTVFTAAGLMEARGESGSVRSSMKGLYQLKDFAAYVQDNLEKDRLSMLVTAFTSGERIYLRKCLHSLELMGNDPNRAVIISTKKLEESLQTQKIKFEHHPFKEANHLGLLKIEPGEDSTQLRLSTGEFRLKLGYIDALCRIDELEPKEHKLSNTRTLIY